MAPSARPRVLVLALLCPHQAQADTGTPDDLVTATVGQDTLGGPGDPSDDPLLPPGVDVIIGGDGCPDALDGVLPKLTPASAPVHPGPPPLQQELLPDATGPIVCAWSPSDPKAWCCDLEPPTDHPARRRPARCDAD